MPPPAADGSPNAASSARRVRSGGVCSGSVPKRAHGGASEASGSSYARWWRGLPTPKNSHAPSEVGSEHSPGCGPVAGAAFDGGEAAGALPPSCAECARGGVTAARVSVQ